MNIIAAYQMVGSYRGAGEICGVTHKTVRRVIERAEAGEPAAATPAKDRARNFDEVTDLVKTYRRAPAGGQTRPRYLRAVTRQQIIDAARAVLGTPVGTTGWLLPGAPA